MRRCSDFVLRRHATMACLESQRFAAAACDGIGMRRSGNRLSREAACHTRISRRRQASSADATWRRADARRRVNSAQMAARHRSRNVGMPAARRELRRPERRHDENHAWQYHSFDDIAHKRCGDGIFQSCCHLDVAQEAAGSRNECGELIFTRPMRRQQMRARR